MISNFEVKQAIGRVYSGGDLCFHPSKLRVFSPINNLLLSIDLDKNTSELMTFQARARTKKVTICQNGEQLIIGDVNDRVYIFDIISGKTLGEKKFKDKISHICFSNNNRLFFVVSGKYIYIYEKPPSGSNVLLEPFLLVKKYNSKANETISALSLTSDDRYFIYAADDNVVRITSILPFKKNAKSFELMGHKNKVLDVKSELNEETGLLLSIDQNGLFLVWKLVDADEKSINDQNQFVRAGKKIKTRIVNNVNEIDTPDKDIEVNSNKIIEASALENKLERSKFILHSKHTIFQDGTSIETYVFHKHLLLIGFANSTFSLYTLDVLADNPFKVLITFKLDDSASRCLKFHPTKPVIVSGNSRQSLSIWDYRGKNFLLNQTALTSEISAFAWNETCSVLAVGDSKGCVKLFDTQTFFNTTTFDDALSKVTGLRFINNTTLISCSLDGKVRAYDLGKGKMFREFKPDVPNQLLALEVETNGEIIFASGMDPYEVYSWSLKTGERLDVFASHSAPVHLLSFAKEAQTLLTASWDRSVRAISVFDRRKNQENLEFGDRLVSLKLSKDEKWFAVATIKNEVQLFNLAQMQIFALIDVNAQFPSSSILSIEPSFDSKSIVVAGKGGSVFTIDVAHRSVVDKLTVTSNREYKFAGEKLNSKLVKDGRVDLSEALTQERASNGMILPGSKGQYQKDEERLEFQISEIGFSSDGKFLTVACSEGLLLFGEKNRKIHWKISNDIDKNFLVSLLSEGKIVEFVVTCLRLEMTELLNDIAYKMKTPQIQSVVRTIDKEMLVTLLDFLKRTLSTCENIQAFVSWIKAMVIFRHDDLITGELKHYARFLLNQLNLELKDFVECGEFNSSALQFLLCQLEA
jgi:periodic tryptophan protein 2